MNKNLIISTSINPPTEAILKFDNLKNWTLIVIGDKKTPKNYKLKIGIYLSPKDQEKIDKNNALLEPALLKVVTDLKALNDAGCTTTAPTTTPPPTSLAPQDIWFSNSSAKKQKAQIKKQRQIKKKKQRQLSLY